MSLLSYPIHPMACDFDVTDEEKTDMEASLKEVGQAADIVLWKDASGQSWVIDGRVRQLCLIRLGIKPRYTFFEGAEEAADAYAQALNHDRRHASDARRSLAAAKYTSRAAGRPAKGDEATTISEAAERFDVSITAVKRCRRLVAEGAPSLLSAVVDEIISVGKAYDICVEPWPAQDLIVKCLRDEVEEKKKAKNEAKEQTKQRDPWDSLSRGISLLAKRLAKHVKRFGDKQGIGEAMIEEVRDLSFKMTRWKREAEKTGRQESKTPQAIFDIAEQPEKDANTFVMEKENDLQTSESPST